jgi:asparagine synthase (glutamine-hydrolysing)
LSGGLDSSGIAALVAQRFNASVKTFGIRFETEDFDEGVHQNRMVSFLGTEHREVQATASCIGERFSETLWHAEKPLLRTGPVPLLMLSGAVRQADLKVVLTGEGADEVFGGYNIFKEAKVRRFWAQNPDSRRRAALLEHIYGYIFRDPRVKRFLPSFFAQGRDRLDDRLFSHLLRWENTSRIKTFFSRELREAIGEADPYGRVLQNLPAGYDKLDTVGKAQYLEMMIFLSNYLLSSQGDRMAMAHSVEIRLPFLDYRLIDLMARVPSKWKILGLNEKHLLKKVLRSHVPEEIRTRRKQPYRAPIAPTLLGDGTSDLALELLSPRAVARAGLFDSAKVERLVKKMQRLDHPGETDNMALAGVLSTQILHQRFVTDFPASVPEVKPRLLVDKRRCASQR